MWGHIEKNQQLLSSPSTAAHSQDLCLLCAAIVRYSCLFWTCRMWVLSVRVIRSGCLSALYCGCRLVLSVVFSVFVVCRGCKLLRFVSVLRVSARCYAFHARCLRSHLGFNCYPHTHTHAHKKKKNVHAPLQIAFLCVHCLFFSHLSSSVFAILTASAACHYRLVSTPTFELFLLAAFVFISLTASVCLFFATSLSFFP